MISRGETGSATGFQKKNRVRRKEPVLFQNLSRPLSPVLKSCSSFLSDIRPERRLTCIDFYLKNLSLSLFFVDRLPRPTTACAGNRHNCQLKSVQLEFASGKLQSICPSCGSFQFRPDKFLTAARPRFIPARKFSMHLFSNFIVFFFRKTRKMALF